MQENLLSGHNLRLKSLCEVTDGFKYKSILIHKEWLMDWQVGHGLKKIDWLVIDKMV